MSHEKKGLFILASLCGLAAIIFSCNKDVSDDAVAPKRMTVAEMKQLFSKIGEQHNKSLDNAFKKLQAYKAGQKKKPKKGNLRMADESDMDVITESVTNDALTFYQEIAPDPVYTTDQIQTYVFGFHYGQIDPYYDHQWFEGVTVSTTLQGLETQLESLVMNSSSTAETISSLESFLNNNINSLTDDNEKMALIAAVDIGKSSAEYWEAHIGEWMALYPEFGDPVPSMVEKSSGKMNLKASTNQSLRTLFSMM